LPFKNENIKMPPEFDRRRKLTESDKAKIRADFEHGLYGVNEAARVWKVSKRLIQFILYPERLAQNKAARAARGGWRQYYDKSKNTADTRNHRRYKQTVPIVAVRSDSGVCRTLSPSELIAESDYSAMMRDYPFSAVRLATECAEFVPTLERDRAYDLGRVKYFYNNPDKIGTLIGYYDDGKIIFDDGNHRLAAWILLYA
jgi:hypothetical protein